MKERNHARIIRHEHAAIVQERDVQKECNTRISIWTAIVLLETQSR